MAGEAQIDALVAGLAGPGWAVVPEWIGGETAAALVAEIRAARAAGTMRPAGVGRGEDFQVRPEVRGDLIAWLEEARLTTAQRVVWDRLSEVRQALNRRLFLGLRGFEGHVTVYPPGGGYARHVDNFRGSAGRIVSCVLYLNEGWRSEDGGQLRLFGGDGTPEAGAVVAEVEPRAGTMAVFLSAGVPHEVVAAGRERFSVTGWFLDQCGV